MYSYDTISIHADCGTDATICEVNVDVHLDNFCAQATFITERITTFTTTTVCSVKEITTTGICCIAEYF